MSFFLTIMILWLFSVGIHEYAHAVVAYAGGDYTARDKGYLQFNIFRYLDPVNSLILPLVFFALGGIPLPGGMVWINRSLLRSRGWETAMSLAGPAANLLIVVLIGLAFRVGWLAEDVSSVSARVFSFLAMLQMASFLLNLIPIPGFDGWGAIEPWVSPETRAGAERFRGWLVFAVFALLWQVDALNVLFWAMVMVGVQITGVDPQLATHGWREFFFWKG